jgi:hypothetical protein
MTIDTIAMLAGIKTANLSEVPDPRGRVDHLASKALEHIARQLDPDVQATYNAARPLIDGLIAKHLGHFRIPESAMKATGEVVGKLHTVRKSA